MSVNLFGETYESAEEYAQRLIRIGLTKPTYKIRIDKIFYHPSRGIEISVLDMSDKKIETGLNFPGIYSIWNGIPSKGNCLYVGGTTHRLNNRVYRFVKELCNVSRLGEESHPAAKKCRLFGYDPHNLYLKVIPKSEFPEIRNDFISMDEDGIEIFIDEYIAPMLNSRFNKKVRK